MPLSDCCRDRPPATTLRTALAHGLLAGTVMACAAAHAETSPWYLGISQTVDYENNLYRLGPDQTLPADASRSDTILATTVQAGLDQSIGRQHVRGSVNLGMNRYQRNSQLNSPTASVDGGLDWAAADQWAGSVSYSGSRTQLKFNTLTVNGALETGRNIVSTQQFDAQVRYGGERRVNLRFGAGYRSVAYSARQYQYRENRQGTVSSELSYRLSGGLKSGLEWKRANGNYPKFLALGDGSYLADRFSRDDLGLTLLWLPGTVSNVWARLGHTRIRYDLDTLRGGSGATATVSWLWKPTAKLQFKTSAVHDLSESSDLVNLGIVGPGIVDYSRKVDYLRIEASHALSAKMSVTGNWKRTTRSLTNTLDLGGAPVGVSSGRDHSDDFGLGISWTPTRSSQVGCDWSSERRRTESLLSNNMSAASINCRGQITLQ